MKCASMGFPLIRGCLSFDFARWDLTPPHSACVARCPPSPAGGRRSVWGEGGRDRREQDPLSAAGEAAEAGVRAWDAQQPDASGGVPLGAAAAQSAEGAALSAAAGD